MKRILGQDAALEILAGAVRSGRVHHAWIFSGPKGVGKFTTAVEFAKIMLDPQAAPNLAGEIEADPNGHTAKLIDAGAHPDLHVIRKELALFSENTLLRSRKLTNIPLDVLRESMIGGKTGDDRIHDGPAYRTASEGHGKVFIVDEAELIDQNGQNALLKTLEEPPGQTYIVLVTSRPERLLPTVRSRCQHVRFTPLNEAAMDAWFTDAPLKADEEERRWIEGFCEGSPGLAKLAAEYGFCKWHQVLAPMLRRLDDGEFPAEMGRAMGDLVEAFATAWVKDHKNASKDAANKDGARHMLSLLGSHARRRLHEACAARGDAARWVGAIDLLREAERQLESNVNLKQLLDNLVVQWAQLPAKAAAARP